jgi:hypothetical protein
MIQSITLVADGIYTRDLIRNGLEGWVCDEVRRGRLVEGWNILGFQFLEQYEGCDITVCW